MVQKQAREIISISVGQAGCQLGSAVWQQYNKEHAVLPGEQWDPLAQNELILENAPKFNQEEKRSHSLQALKKAKTFYSQASTGGALLPRGLFVDLESSVIQQIKKSPLKKQFADEKFIAGKEDAANNFARGHYTVGKELMETINDRIKKMVGSCENLQGFLVCHAVGGGTGSGLGMLILERLAVDYRKKSKLGFEIYPSPTISTCIVEPYNGLLSTHWLLDHTEVSLILDNEALYQICTTNLDISKVTYSHLNKLCAKSISCMTAALRFEGELNVDMNEFQTNLVPFPRLHFMSSSYSPLVANTKKDKDQGVWDIVQAAFNFKNFNVKYDDFDVNEDKYMAISVNFRGKVTAKEANASITQLKKNNKVTFVEWMPTGFKLIWWNIAMKTFTWF